MSMVNKKVFWNTGCWYTEHGQRMGAVWDGERIHYVDVDRMISGAVKCSNVMDEHDLKRKTMSAYDDGLGDRCWQDHLDKREELEQEATLKAPSLKEKHDELVARNR